MSSGSLRILPPVLFTAALSLIIACGNEHREETAIDNVKTFPTMLTTDVSTFISDSGYTRYHVEAPLWIMYEEADTPYWTFPEGLDMEKYDDSMVINATFRSDSAVYYSVRKLWRFDGNVIMRNTDGDRFATPQLFWDQNSKRVYSDSFMHIERSERIIEGYGFESNDQMTEYTVLHPQMILPIDRMRQERQERAAEDSINNASKDSLEVTPSPTSVPEPRTNDRAVPDRDANGRLRRTDRLKLDDGTVNQVKTKDLN